MPLFRVKLVLLHTMKRACQILISLLVITILYSCNNTDKLIKSTDNEAKFNAAVQYFNEKRYSRARQIFENLIQYYHGNEHAKDIAWYYACCLKEGGYYYNAAYQFKTFAKRYPYSTEVEEACFQAAMCEYLDSPAHTLDQTTTRNAIADFEAFTERYPQSTRIPEVNSYLDELRGKLIQKDYEIAVGYYNIESYRAASVALNNFLNNYPGSIYQEDAMYYIIKSGYEYAINSREDKMKERLQQVVNNFDKFATTFSNSKYLSECQKIYNECRRLLASEK